MQNLPNNVRPIYESSDDRAKQLAMKLPIPTLALTQHIITLGKTRSGKSSKMRVIVEYLLEHERPVCIIDPKGDWWGLKSSHDGKRAGYPIVIFGGEHADVPLNAHAGAAVAELIATGNRPALIDLGGWMVGERTRFFVDFTSNFFKLTRGARFLVIDEVHNFAPQGRVMDPDSAKMLHWSNRLASEGAGKGVTLIAASQRPQKVHKDFVTSCETLIACRVVHKLDRDAIKDWIDGCADPAKGKQVLTELAGMKREEAWVWSPEIEFGPARITWPMFSTYDSFKPQAADAGKLKGWAEVDLEDVREKLSASIKEAQENDPKALRAKIAELQRALAKPKELAVDVELLAATVVAADNELKGYKRGWAECSERARELFVEAARTLDPPPTPVRGSVTTRRQPQRYEGPPVRIEIAPETLRKVWRPGERAPRPSLPGNGKLPKGESMILAALIQFPGGRTRSQLMVLTGYATRSLTTYLPQLMQRGYVEAVSGLLRATSHGREALPDIEPLPQGKALQDHWLTRLPAGERRILEVLLAAQGEPVTRDELLQRTEYATRSLTTYIPRLAARGLVVAGRGDLRASEDLF